MKKSEIIFLIIFLSGVMCFAQNPSCSNGYVYMDGGPFISYYDPSLPLSSTNPMPTSIPTFTSGGGLTLMPNISGGTLSPTFYTTSGGNYWYWNGVAWTNTGHSTGNGAAVNIAGCGTTIYNIVGSSGQVYSYNGGSNGSLLTTLQGFSGGGPYDLVTDCNCNFYSLKTSTPNQGLTRYSPTGSILCTYSLNGMPNISLGGGFAIIDNKVYLKNNGSPGFYVGTMSGGAVTFSAVAGFTNTPGDFASCSVCYPNTSLAGSSISGGTLNCNIPIVNLIATTSVFPVTYTWTGPGIVSSATSSVVIVNTAGTYSCLISTATCPPTQITLTTSVPNNSVFVSAALTPSGTVCKEMGALKKLKVAHTSPNEAVFWNGPSSYLVVGADSVFVNQPGNYTVNVVDVASGCTATDVVTIHQTPTVSIALSDNTVCLQNYNSSPSTITITPSGALNYTLLTGFNFSTTSPNGPIMPCFPVTIFGNLSSQATPTLIGSDGVCSDTTQASFSILSNPDLTLSATSASICPNTSTLLIAGGADQYLWGGSAGLNTYTGSNVIAAPINLFSMYSVIGTSLGCQSQTYSVTVTVLPLPTLTISPSSSTICLGTSLSLSVNGTATSYTWAPSIGIVSPINSATVNVSPPSSLIYSGVGSLNSCTSSVSSTVYVEQPPVLSLALSSTTLCAQNFNNSSNFILLTPSGAFSYTMLTDPGISIISPNGPVMQAVHASSLASGPSVFTATLIGKTGVCTVNITKNFTVIPNPILTISPASASACPGESKAFSVSGANSYTWLPKPSYTVTGNSSIVANPSLTSFYSVIGTENGCHSAIRNAVLLVLPIPQVSVSPKTNTVCLGQSVVINAFGNASSYQWSPPVTLSSSSGSMVTATPLAFQTYTVKATLNTCTNQAVSSVSVIQIPVIYASSTQPTICSSSPTQLDVTGADSFQWFPFESLNSKSGNLVIASPNKSTTYTVHGYNGICTGSTTVHVTTVKRPDMDLITTSNKVCKGYSLPITLIGAHSYTWAPLNSTIPSGVDSIIIAAPKVSTHYTVFGATSMGSVSCYQQLSYFVGVVPEIIPRVSKDAVICIGDKTSLFASGGNSFSWTPSEGLSRTDVGGVLASPKITTIYTVEVSENTYCGKTTTVMVSVNPKPEVYAGRDTSYNINEAIFIHAEGTGSLTWVRGEDILCMDCPYTQVYPKRDGCYLVQAMNDFGCSVTDEVCIELTEDFTVYIPNTFSPNNDGKNDEFLIYGENITEISMEIYNRWGVRIFYSEDFEHGWDGKFKDAICPVGAYTYVIRYTGLDRKKYTKTGNVNLIK